MDDIVILAILGLKLSDDCRGVPGFTLVFVLKGLIGESGAINCEIKLLNLCVELLLHEFTLIDLLFHLSDDSCEVEGFGLPFFGNLFQFDLEVCDLILEIVLLLNVTVCILSSLFS